MAKTKQDFISDVAASEMKKRTFSFPSRGANTRQSVFIKKTDADLKKELMDSREALRQFRFGIAGSKTKNVKESAHRRKIIARILTEINARVKSASA